MLSLVLCSVLAQAPVSRIDERPIAIAVQTDDAAIWAIRDGKVARFDDGWRALEGSPTGTAVGLISDGERGVVSMWKTGTGSELWRHGKKEAARVATLPTPPPADLSLTVQRDGSVWITGSTRRLINVARSGVVTTLVLDAAWLVTPEMKTKPVCRGLSANGCCDADASVGQLYCGRVQAFERDGSMWFWSTGSSNSFVLPGLLQYSKGTFTPWRSPGLPDAVTRAVLPFEHHALLSAQSALYRLDLVKRTVTTEPFPPLKDQTPQDILSLHRSGTATWALAQRGFQQREGQLFRDDGSGFRKVLDGVGGLIAPFARQATFVSAKAPDGQEHAWLATPEGPLWHFGAGAPELIDWAAGLATSDITGLFVSRVGANRTLLLVTDRSQGTFRLPVFEPVTRPLADLLRFPLQRRALTWSADGRLFWLEGVEPLALHEWTGTVMELRRPPSPLRDVFISASTVIADADDVWVVPLTSRGFADQGPAVARFGKGGWVIHQNAPTALAAGIERATPFHGLDSDALIAVTKDARCMKDPNSNLTCAFRDGKRQTWTAAEISGGPNSSFWTSPTVDGEGQLRVLVNRLGRNVRWTWNGSKWSASEDTSLPPLPTTTGCKGSPGMVQGIDGREWFATREGLMVGRKGVCRLRRAGVALDGIEVARFDSKHHDVLVRDQELIVLLDVDRFPETTLGAPKQENARLMLEVKGASIAEVKVDGADWSIFELKNSTLDLNGLAKGAHHLEVRAADEQLRVDPTPASVDVVVR